MKQLLVVNEPESVGAAQAIVGKGLEVAFYTPEIVVKGRKVVYWPTAPGNDATTKAKAMAADAAEVKVLITTGQPDGWNASIAHSEGWNIDKFIEWAKPRSILVIPETKISADESPANENQQETLERLGMIVSAQGTPICNAANIVKFLENTPSFKDHLWYDEFLCQVMTDDGPWNDAKTNALMINIQRSLGLHRLSSQHVSDAVTFFANTDKRHQVRDWLNCLKWDNKERIGNFFPSYMGAAPTASNYAFSSNFWVALVKRAYEPGCQSDYMIVLEGAQGIGKTRSFRIIGGQWYAEIGITADSEDFERQLQGKILVEIAELHSFSKSDQSRIKQIITKCVDRYREKYGRIAIDHPRQCLLVGTTNETEWIKDQTGGRRFWPIKCGAIDSEMIKHDRSQLFAEAVERYKGGDPGYFVPKDEVIELQEQRREHEPWEEVLREKLLIVNRLSMTEAMGYLDIPKERMDNRVSRRVAQVLKRLGYHSRIFTIAGESKRFWSKNEDHPQI